MGSTRAAEPSEMKPLQRSWLATCKGLVLSILSGTVLVGVKDRIDSERRSQQSITEHEAAAIAKAIMAYHSEYGKYPVPPDHASERDAGFPAGDFLTKTLAGREPLTNPKGIDFLSAQYIRAAKLGEICGTVDDANGLRIIDAWGEPFYIIVDTDGTGELNDPDPTNRIVSFRSGALAYSGGRDKDPETWKDNLTSWPTYK